jgi:hypothetical protein
VPANEPSNNGTTIGPGEPGGAWWMCAANTVPSMFAQSMSKQIRL